MNTTQNLITKKKCQFFLIFIALFFLSNIANSSENRKNFICGYKYVFEYINSLITLDRHSTLAYIDQLRNNTITEEGMTELVVTLMRYRLLPINENRKKCRYYSYMCIPVHTVDTVYEFAETYLQNNPAGPDSCYIRSNGREKTIPIFDEGCREAIEKRIRAIPTPLAVTQAGLESAWGTSNFSNKGNNLFGIQTTFASAKQTQGNSKCIAARRNTKRCVYKFNSIETSAFIYSQLLNSGNAYISLREYRYQAETENDNPCDTASKMANGLSRYAEDPNYVQKIKRTIKSVCQIIDSC